MSELFKMTSKTYDNLKWIAQYLLPALGTLYFALAGIWNFPYAEQVVGTITALDTFLGVILGISNKNYVEENSDDGIAEEADAKDVESGAEG